MIVNENDEGSQIFMATPFNLNDPMQLQKSMEEISYSMMQSKHESIRRDGIWMLAISKGFSAAIADARLHQWTVVEQIQACLNFSATVLGLMVSASSDNMEEATVNGLQVSQEFSKQMIAIILRNRENGLPCNEDGSATPTTSH